MTFIYFNARDKFYLQLILIFLRLMLNLPLYFNDPLANEVLRRTLNERNSDSSHIYSRIICFLPYILIKVSFYLLI